MITADQLPLANEITFDSYQECAARQIVADPDGRTIRGYPPEAYMYLGLREEYEETWGDDSINPEYNRLGALMLGSRKFSNGEASGLAVELHRKEFGDIAWYLANFLSLHGISMAEAAASVCPVGERSLVDYEAAVRQGTAGAFSGLMSGGRYLNDAYQILQASEQVLRHGSEADRMKLQLKAGNLLGSMSLVLQTKLDTTLAAVLVGNQAKLAARIRNNSLFDKTGGDIR